MPIKGWWAQCQITINAQALRLQGRGENCKFGHTCRVTPSWSWEACQGSPKEADLFSVFPVCPGTAAGWHQLAPRLAGWTVSKPTKHSAGFIHHLLCTMHESLLLSFFVNQVRSWTFLEANRLETTKARKHTREACLGQLQDDFRTCPPES